MLSIWSPQCALFATDHFVLEVDTDLAPNSQLFELKEDANKTESIVRLQSTYFSHIRC